MSWRTLGTLASVEVGQIGKLISKNRPEIVELVSRTYDAFYKGHCENPDTYSLRLPQKPGCRINALPAYIGDGLDVAGVKWIASFPKNVERNLLRATAAIILNCGETGYPIALLDGTQISAARTAASAALAARLLRPARTCERLCL